MLLSNLLEYNINQYEQYPFLTYKDSTYTNTESFQLARKYSLVLKSHGIKKGDKIVVCMPNRPEVIFSYHGIFRRGAIVVPIMFLLQAQEINYILKDSEAKVVITSSDMMPKILEAIKGLPNKPKVYVVDTFETANMPGGIEVVDLIYVMSNLNPLEEKKATGLKSSDLGVILYTSGTTGRPKGVMLTHRNIYSNLEQSAKTKNDERLTTVSVLPLAHTAGFCGSFRHILSGQSVVILEKFELEPLFEAIEKYRVKHTPALGAMMYSMINTLVADKYDLSSLEYVTTGTAPTPVPLMKKFSKKFNVDVLENYGLSEATSGVSTTRRDIPIKLGSAGIPLPGVEIKIVDDNENEVPVGEVGELIVKGENVFVGYYKNEEETKKVLKNGWLYTGDLAKVDEDGYLYIVGRKKDLIIRGGFNIYPSDLENLLMKHSAVGEVAVVGIASERMGEEILACVVIKKGTEVTEDELIAYCQQHLALYKTPKRVVFLNDLPRNGVGKVLKKQLIEKYVDIEFYEKSK